MDSLNFQEVITLLSKEPTTDDIMTTLSCSPSRAAAFLWAWEVNPIKALNSLEGDERIKVTSFLRGEPVSELKAVLLSRGDMTEAEIDEQIAEGQTRVLGGEDPTDVLEELFGVEPDYFMDLMP